MIFEYHHLRVNYAITNPKYYLDQMALIGAYDIVWQDRDLFVDLYVKTFNLRFKSSFRENRRFYRMLHYVRKIQKYNFKAIKKSL